MSISIRTRKASSLPGRHAYAKVPLILALPHDGSRRTWPRAAAASTASGLETPPFWREMQHKGDMRKSPSLHLLPRDGKRQVMQLARLGTRYCGEDRLHAGVPTLHRHPLWENGGHEGC